MAENNDLPLGVTAIGIAATLLASIAIDASGKHLPWGVLTCGLQLIAAIVLLCWSRIGNAGKMAAYCESSTTVMTVSLFGKVVTSS